MKIRSVKRFFIGYFVVSGLFAHFLATATVIKRPDKIPHILETATSILIPGTLHQDHVVPSSRMDIIAEIEANFENWAPLDTPTSEPGVIRIDNNTYKSLAEAARALTDGDTLSIGEGIYREPMVISANDVSVVGRGHVVIEDTSAEGKAAIITKGSNTQIRNIECRNISVPDGNGACIRHEGRHLSLEHVYFHSSEQGVLTGGSPGLVNIRDSRFELLGSGGRAHGLYIGGGQLEIRDSLILASKEEGHEIKSRAESTVIENSVVASLSSNDSRLIDISNGGRLYISKSILAQGPNSSNQDAIGWGLEGLNYTINETTIADSIVILERRSGNVLIHQHDSLAPANVQNSVIVSKHEQQISDSNLVFGDREKAGFKPYPHVPIDLILR